MKRTISDGTNETTWQSCWREKEKTLAYDVSWRRCPFIHLARLQAVISAGGKKDLWGAVNQTMWLSSANKRRTVRGPPGKTKGNGGSFVAIFRRSIHVWTWNPPHLFFADQPWLITNFFKKRKKLNFCVLCIVKFEALSNELDLGRRRV